MGDTDTMTLALAVDPMGGGDWCWRWFDLNSGRTLADGVEGSERAAWTAATSHYVQSSDVVVRRAIARAEALEREVARLRAVIAEAAADLPAPGDVVGTMTCRSVAEQVRDDLLDSLAQPAGEVSDD